MGRYTAYDLQHVDACVEAHMETLKDLCVATLGPNLKSLVLSGSFGRGEGSVLLHTDGSVEPLRDYDVRLIVQQPTRPAQLEQIRSEFMRVTGLGRADERFSGEQGFSLTLEPLTETQLSSAFVRDHDLRVYDHLNASRVIYGEDYSPPLRFPASDIPKVNGLRLLYQKMMGLVGHFSGPKLEAEGQLRRTLIYECDKTFVEICTALVLLAGSYVPSYRARAELFEQNWSSWFPFLAEHLPDLGAEVRRATHAKLYPELTSARPPLAAFQRAREALLIVHQFYWHRLYDLTVVAGPRGCAQVRRVLQRDYFRMAVTHWLGQRSLNYRLTRWALNTAYHRRLRFGFARGAGCSFFQTLWHGLKAGEAPLLDIFLAAWCALAALEPTPDETLLRCAEHWLGHLPGPGSAVSHLKHWDRYLAIRDRIAQGYLLCEHNG